jgi:inhibitor of KinA
MDGISLLPASDHSVLVTLGNEISLEVYGRVRRFCALLERSGHEAIGNYYPAYASVLVSFEPGAARLEEVGRFLESLLWEVESTPLPDARLIEIPVCYGGELGPDLEDVARYAKLPPAEVVRLYSSAEYFVHFLGFVPGFPYLGGLAPAIAAPRLATPRKKVPAGSVAIGGSQAGVYPIESPGGWRLIGRTPLRLFTPEEDSPVLLRMGDRVRFVSLTRGEFDRACQ